MPNQIWVKVHGYENDFNVNQYGEVQRLADGHIMKQSTTTTGYKIVYLNGKQKRVHSLVLESFIGKPDFKCEVNHKDGNKENNNLDNLEWLTHSANIKHARDNGLFSPKLPHGEKHYCSKLTEQDVINIKSKYKYDRENFSGTKIAKQYGINRCHLYAILNEKNWKHIQV